MGKDYTRLLTELLIAVKNLNDKARQCEDTLFTICAKISQLEKEKPTEQVVVLRIEDEQK